MCKSLRESDKGNIVDDIRWLKDNNYISEKEEQFLNGEIGFRKVRNMMSHKDAQQLFWDMGEGIVYPFAEPETWNIIYDVYVPETIRIMEKMVFNKSVESRVALERLWRGICMDIRNGSEIAVNSKLLLEKDIVFLRISAYNLRRGRISALSERFISERFAAHECECNERGQVDCPRSSYQKETKMPIRLYEVDSKYVDYLSKYAPHLFHNKKDEQKHSRKYIGILLTVNGADYFAPLSSFKPKHAQLTERAWIRKRIAFSAERE